MKYLHVLIAGKVQGVWFRESTRQEAERLGVGGWVQNLPDGRVEGHFCGDDSAVDALANWCRRGPEGAHVDAVVVEPSDDHGSYPTFTVRRS